MDDSCSGGNRKVSSGPYPGDHGEYISLSERTSVFCMTLTFWAVVTVTAVIRIYYGLMIFNSLNGTEGQYTHADLKTRYHLYGTTLTPDTTHLYTIITANITPKTTTKHSGEDSTGPPELISQIKTLYVLSRNRRTTESSFTWDRESKLFNSSSGTNKTGELTQKSNDTLGVGQGKLCATSVRDYEKMFKCSKLLPSLDNIFFLETSCAANQSTATADNTRPVLSKKQACSIYSAAHYNPSRKVILLFTCPIPKAFNWTAQLKILFDLPNFFFGRVDLENLYANTSLSEFYHGSLSLSKHSVAHQADLLRMLIVYLYGGSYMDMDVISFKPLDGLGGNYVINQDRKTVVIINAVFNLEPKHPFLKESMINGMLNYDPNDWETLGPYLFTDTLERICNVSRPVDPKTSMNLPSCKIRVLPGFSTFFRVPWSKFRRFVDSKGFPGIEKIINGSFGVHYWNSRTAAYNLSIGSKQLLIKLAERHCPPVYYNAGQTLS